jgi:hypothetical protein
MERIFFCSRFVMAEQIFTWCVQTSEGYHHMALKILINAVLNNCTQKLTSYLKMKYTIADLTNAGPVSLFLIYLITFYRLNCIG